MHLYYFRGVTDSFWWASGCGSVGRAIAPDTKGPRFESSHRQKFIKHLFTVNCIETTKIKKKIGREWPILENI